MDPPNHQCPEQTELRRQLHEQIQNCCMEQARLAKVAAREEQLRREYQQLIATFRQEVLEKESLQNQFDDLLELRKSDLEHIRNIHHVLAEILRQQEAANGNGNGNNEKTEEEN